MIILILFNHWGLKNNILSHFLYASFDMYYGASELRLGSIDVFILISVQTVIKALDVTVFFGHLLAKKGTFKEHILSLIKSA